MKNKKAQLLMIKFHPAIYANRCMGDVVDTFLKGYPCKPSGEELQLIGDIISDELVRLDALERKCGFNRMKENPYGYDFSHFCMPSGI